MKKNLLNEFNLTKIVATLGPASASESMIRKLVKQGANVFRINFSHGSENEYLDLLKKIRNVSRDTGVPVAVLGDLPGPKIRLGDLPVEGISLKKKDRVMFVRGPVKSMNREEGISLTTNYPALIDEVMPGERILIDDGNIHLVCKGKKGKGKDLIVEAEVLEGGKATSRKGVNLPDTNLALPSLTHRDEKLVEFAVKNGFDYLALSFVRSARDIISLKNLLKKLGARPADPVYRKGEHDLTILEGTYEGIIPVVTKIEKPQAVDDLDSILGETDVVMVARGDLGVEMDLAEVAVVQKKIISRCREQGVPVIVATQMLQSMIENPSPTRAEVSDVANAIFDGADAVMLSGETAMGRYPGESVRVMNRIARKTNDYIRSDQIEMGVPSQLQELKFRASALASGVKATVAEMDVKLVAVWSQLGGSAVFLSQYRLPLPVIAFSPDENTLRLLSLLYGIFPVQMEPPSTSHEFIRNADRVILQNRWAKKGDAVVYVFREPIGHVGLTNQMSIHYLGELED